MRYTVLGATGFVGSHVAQLARTSGHEVFCPAREASLTGLDLGHVIYAIGLTSDFRQRPHETITAHVTKLQQVLRETSFDSLVYLSSTRVYARCAANSVVAEEMPLSVLSSDFSDLYNLSKLMGESIALTYGPKVKVARLSNVVGVDLTSDNFLISVTRDCIQSGHVNLQTAWSSCKDYVSVDDVAEVLLRLGVEGQQSIYNLASGTNTTHRQIALELEHLTGSTFRVLDGAPEVKFPQIAITRLQREFGFTPRSIATMIESLVSSFRSIYSQHSNKNAA